MWSNEQGEESVVINRRKPTGYKIFHAKRVWRFLSTGVGSLIFATMSRVVQLLEFTKTNLTALRSFLKGSDCKLSSVLSFLLILNKKIPFSSMLSLSSTLRLFMIHVINLSTIIVIICTMAGLFHKWYGSWKQRKKDLKPPFGLLVHLTMWSTRKKKFHLQVNLNPYVNSCQYFIIE